MSPGPKKSNERLMPRYEVDIQAECLIAGQRLKVDTLDVSLGGFAIRVEPGFPTMPVLKLRFTLPNGRFFEFDVTEKYRGLLETDNDDTLRLGLQTLRSSEDAVDFFRHVTNPANAREAKAGSGSQQPATSAEPEAKTPKFKEKVPLQPPPKPARVEVKERAYRTYQPRAKRVKTNVPVLLRYKDRVVIGKTLEFSERGVSVVVSEEVPLVPTTPMKCRGQDGKEFNLWAEERNRLKSKGSKSFWRIGYKIHKAGPGFDQFLLDHNIAPRAVWSQDEPTTPHRPHAPRKGEAHDQVSKLLLQFDKAREAAGAGDERVLDNAVNLLFDRFDQVFSICKSLELGVTSLSLTHEDEPVYTESQRPAAMCFNLYQDGIRTLVFQYGLAKDELRRLLLGLHETLNRRGLLDDDLVTLFFRLDLEHVEIHYLDDVYADPEHEDALRHMEAELRSPRPFDGRALAHGAQPLKPLAPLFRQIEDPRGPLDLSHLALDLTPRDEAEVRRQGLYLLTDAFRGKQGLSFERLATMTSAIFSSANRLADFDTSLLALDQLTDTAMNTGQKETAALRRFREALATPEFVNLLLAAPNDADPDGSRRRKLIRRVAGRAFAQRLLRRYLDENDPNRRTLLAEWCVSAASESPELIHKEGSLMRDELAAPLAAALQHLSSGLKTAVKPWLAYKGLKTRRALLDVLLQHKRAEAASLLLHFLLDDRDDFQKVRAASWRRLLQRKPSWIAKCLNLLQEAPNYAKVRPEERARLLKLAGEKEYVELQAFLAMFLLDDDYRREARIGMDECRQAVEILGQFQTSKGRDALRRAAESDHPLKRECARALEVKP